MSLPVIFDSMENVLMEVQVNEILKTNEQSQKYGLWLNAEDSKEIVETRNNVLQNYGRVELDIRVTREIINRFCTSPFINQEDYPAILNELVEIFYYMKNETEDGIGDEDALNMLKDFFDGCCGGSIELLKGTIETFSAVFKGKTMNYSLEKEVK